MFTFKPGWRPTLIKEFVPARNLGGCCSDSICKHLTQIHWGKEKGFCQSLPLAPHLSKINRLVYFGLAKVFKQIAFDTSHRTISKVKTTIFLQEHTKYLDIKKARLARPHWACTEPPALSAVPSYTDSAGEPVIYWLFPPIPLPAASRDFHLLRGYIC